MVICHVCQTENNPDSLNCSQCGALLGKNETGNQNTSNPSPPPSQQTFQYCRHCGKPIAFDGRFCPHCGKSFVSNAAADQSEKEWIVALLLCIFLGGLGLHRFYAGKIGTGILMIITCGGCGIWQLIDLIMIAIGNFTDIDGKYIKQR